jgi:hypothetical protein
MIPDTPKPPNGRDIWQALKEELRNNLYPLPSVTLAPTVYHVYLHAADFDFVEGIVSRIAAEMANALTREVETLNEESARQRGPLRGWLQQSADATPPIEVPAGGWEVHIQPDHDGELPRGRIGLVSKLMVPPRPEYGGTPTIRTVKAVFTDGRRSVTATDLAPPTTRTVSPFRATLRYQDEAGDHVFPVRKDLIKIGRGGSDAWVDVQVITTPKVSREHCWIRADANGRFFIRDVSTWGTSIDGQLIPAAVRSSEGQVVEPGAERELPADAVIALADAVTMTFHAEGLA